MKYAYITLVAIMFGAGWYCGSKFSSRPTIREVPVVTTKTVTETRIVEKTPDGKVVERVITQTQERSPKVSAQPKAEYRVGTLLPIASELKLPTVSASRRLGGGVWLDAQVDPRHREILIGISYEF